ncbi:MAG: cytochrome c oxidase accessory protein CcoG [Candidatus Latescibacterota bacterium]
MTGPGEPAGRAAAGDEAISGGQRPTAASPLPSGLRAHIVFDIAPEEELLYSLAPDGHRILFHPRLARGRYWRIRRALAYPLIVLFLALPLVPVGGHPAVLLDLVARRFHVFGAVFHPTDNLLLLAFGAGVILTVFFLGAVLGRLWCGYACPQNVHLEFVFRPIEVALEGERAAQARLNAAPWSLGKLGRKAAKWSLWAAISAGMAATFMAYFVGWRGLLEALLGDPLAHRGLLLATLALAGLIVFDQGWFRDQMCTLACPYGRLQHVLADQDTLIPAYDARRGEPRGRPGKGQDRTLFGDCLDCRACLAACPTGVDIRRGGLQLECVGIGQCMDACNAVMAREGLPPGLIRYTSERALAGGGRRFWRARVFVYLALMALAWGSLVTMVLRRGEARVEIVRGGREAFRVLPTGQIANQQRLRLTSQLPETQTFTVDVLAPQGARLLVPESPIVAEPAAVRTLNIVTEVPPEAFVRGRVTGVYLVRSDAGFAELCEFPLLGPDR